MSTDLGFIRTGSISQDALRLGFQTTCSSGIEKLLKVDDITTEACESFKTRHEEELKIYLNTFCEKIAGALEERFYNREIRGLTLNKYRDGNSFNWPIFTSLNFYFSIFPTYKKQPRRPYKVEFMKVGESTLDLSSGEWVTKIYYRITSPEWSGYSEYGPKSYDVVDKTEVYRYSTSAKHCKVQYIDYSDYHHRYIPDEAVEAASQAISIGMTNLKVAMPVISDAKQRDPIIVGFVNKQMFIIAWFGYDKTNHMVCNI